MKATIARMLVVGALWMPGLAQAQGKPPPPEGASVNQAKAGMVGRSPLQRAPLPSVPRAGEAVRSDDDARLKTDIANPGDLNSIDRSAPAREPTEPLRP